MKLWPKLLIFVFFIACSEKQPLTIQERFNISYHNFIPVDGSKTPNYWNTWGVQNYAGETSIVKRIVSNGNDLVLQANQLTEDNIFGKQEWASYFPKTSKDLYILFDFGWNIPEGTKPDKDQWQLGSFELAQDKFTSCHGTPVERLLKLNELCKNAGWRGAALRIAAHPANAAYSIQFQLEQIRRIYYERLSWCHEAGIEYIQVNDGFFSYNIEFRKMLTRVAKEAAPNLIIEHIQKIAPINDYPSPNNTFVSHKTGTFSEWDNGLVLQNAKNIINFSDVFYVNKVTASLSTPTTMERAAQVLQQFAEPSISKGLINLGDEPFLAAALGCSMGIFRHAMFVDIPEQEYDPFSTHNRIDEVFRAIRWQRLAPAYGVGRAPVYVDAKRLTDSWIFKKGDSMEKWLIGDTIIQKAPAIISRGMPLPNVGSEGEPSYVVCSKYPSGAIALATLPRISFESGLYYPLVDIIIESENWDKPIAVFGELKSLTIKFKKLPKKVVVWGQDLASSRAVRITDLIKVNENTFKLSGELIKEIGLLGATPGDESYPGMFLLVRKK